MPKAEPFNAADHLDTPQAIADYLREAHASGDADLISGAVVAAIEALERYVLIRMP